MKKLILAVIVSLAVAGGTKEAGAAPCCCSSSMGAGIAEDNKDTVAGGTDCVTLGEMADHEGTRGPRDPEAQGNSEATGRPSESHQLPPANEAVSPIVQEDSR
jgi:hypothetical protein